MKYTTLGHSGITISQICLGGMSFGEPSPDFHQWTIGPEETQAVIARAYEQGINLSTPQIVMPQEQAKNILVER